MNKTLKVQKLLNKKFKDIKIINKDNCALLEGEVDNYDDLVKAGLCVAKTKLFDYVINEIKWKNHEQKATRTPKLNDTSLNEQSYDVVVIGGGVVGASILRELTKYNLKVCLLEKEDDVALHASSRNDGDIHPGIDLKKGSLKLKYLQRSRQICDQLFKDLDVDYRQDGQMVCFLKWSQLPLVSAYLHMKARQNKVPGFRILKGKKLREKEPNLSHDVKFAGYFPNAGVVCPYNYTIALAESAIINGAKVHLSTYVKDMLVSNHQIEAIITNRGIIRSKVVVNAAGVFADEIAKMADDKFFSIHPRKGTDLILDKSSHAKLTNSSVGTRLSLINKSHSKGGGVMPTIDMNMLVGPTAHEVFEKEDFTTSSKDVEELISKNKLSIPNLNRGQIITYFSGIRAATYEEDFIVSKGRWTKNIVHAAGIQSPGLTAAPAIAEDIAKYVCEIIGNVEVNANFNPIRKSPPVLRNLSLDDRDKLIKTNPNYGIIVCRCEEISKGEIIDAMRRPLECNSVDAIKRRVRTGMGRCQGGFCQPLVVSIMAEEKGVDLKVINKKGDGRILFSKNKEDLI